jgi:hypothetical protein
MATTSFNTIGTAPARTGGLFRRALARMATARELQARHRVNDYLLMLDDARLAAFGLDRMAKAKGLDGRFPW